MNKKYIDRDNADYVSTASKTLKISHLDEASILGADCLDELHRNAIHVLDQEGVRNLQEYNNYAICLK